MGGAWIIILLVAGLGFGVVGVLIAAHKNASTTAGFWLGALLGPIGLVIVALLGPVAAPGAPQPSATPREFAGAPDLANDGYRLWLTGRFGIQKNDVLGKYVVGERLFSTVDDALEHCRELDEAEREAAEADKARRAAEREKQREEERRYLQQAEETFQRRKPYMIGAGVFVAIVGAYFIYLGVKNERERSRIAKAEVAAEKAKEDSKRDFVNRALAEYGLILADTARDAHLGTEARNCTWSAQAEEHTMDRLETAHFVTETYPPKESADDVKFLKRADWVDQSASLYTLMLDEQRLFRNKATEAYALITVDDETDYKAPGLTFKVRVDVCVGKLPTPKPAVVEEPAVPETAADDSAEPGYEPEFEPASEGDYIDE